MPRKAKTTTTSTTRYGSSKIKKVKVKAFDGLGGKTTSTVKYNRDGTVKKTKSRTRN